MHLRLFVDFSKRKGKITGSTCQCRPVYMTGVRGFSNWLFSCCITGGWKITLPRSPIVGPPRERLNFEREVLRDIPRTGTILKDI